MLAASISLGRCFFGPEGPSVEITNFGILLGQVPCKYLKSDSACFLGLRLDWQFNAPIAVFLARGGTRNHVCHFSGCVVLLAAVVAALAAQVLGHSLLLLTRLRSPQSVGISFVWDWFVCQFDSITHTRSGSESLLLGVTVHLLSHRQLFIL